MKIFARLESWGGAVARVWGKYWLLLLGSFFVVGSGALKWVEFPFSRNLKGLQFPLFANVGMVPHISLFSYGFLAVVVLAAGLIFFRLSFGFLAAAAAVLLTLFALAPAHLAFQQPAMLQRLTEESEAMPLIKAFTKDYLPQNYGAAEDIPKRFVLYSGWGRFVAAWSFLGLGWYILGLGAFFVGLYALAGLRGQRAFVLAAIFGLPLAALAIVLAPAMIGQHYFTNGAIAKAHGQNRSAIAAFRKAMRWDSWHSRDIDLYATIGQLERAAGMPEGSPEQHINKAMTFEKESQWDQAIFELEAAAKSGGALGETARQEAARAHVFFGLALYHAGGIGSAVTNWQEALIADPGQIYSLPYLARAYFDIGRYDSALETVEELVKIVRDHKSLLGDAYSLGGDASARMGRIVEARNYYRLSLTADPVENYWALTGLVGE